MTPSVKAFLVPTLAAMRCNRRLLPPPASTQPGLMTMKARRATFGPNPGRDIELSVHRGGAFGLDVRGQYFSHPDMLLPSAQRWDLHPIPQPDLDEARACYWDMMGTDYHAIWVKAQIACGHSEPAGKTPYGDVDIHLFDSFVAYVAAPEEPMSNPMRAASDIANSSLRAEISSQVDPDQPVLAIAWLIETSPSSHERLQALKDVARWLDWLAVSQGWPPFSTPSFAAPVD